MDILELRGVEKRFGTLPVLNGLTFSVPEHAVFGLIGKNGAGKTTAMKLILGFLRADAGEIRVCGEQVVYGSARANRHIGYLPDVPEFYGYMRPKEYLALCGEIAGMPAERIRSRSAELLALVGLVGENRKIRGFSRGMKQRLGIAQALLAEPALLICDEPTSALDPVGRKEILDILSEAGKRTSILFSTHILSDVERVCNHIAILNGGKIALEGRLEALRGRFRRDAVHIRLSSGGRAAELAADCRALPFVRDAAAEESALTLRVDDIVQNGPAILQFLAGRQAPVLQYEVLEPTLEDVFLEVVR